MLPGLLARWQKSLAGVKLSVREAYTPVLLRQVGRGMIDGAIVTDSDAGRPLSIHPLLREPFALIASAARGLKPAVSVAQLSRIPHHQPAPL